jgi:hypothetical protein
MKLKKWFGSEDGDSKYEEEEGLTTDMKTARRRIERTRLDNKKTRVHIENTCKYKRKDEDIFSNIARARVIGGERNRDAGVWDK